MVFEMLFAALLFGPMEPHSPTSAANPLYLTKRTENEWICTRCRKPAEGHYCSRCGQPYERPVKSSTP